MLFNVLPQAIIIISASGLVYLFLRQDQAVRAKEQRLISTTWIGIESLASLFHSLNRYLNQTANRLKTSFKQISQKRTEQRNRLEKKKGAVKKAKHAKHAKEEKNAIRLMILEQRYIDQISRNPRNLEAYINLGRLYKQKGEPNHARACFRQVLKINPGHQQARTELDKL